MAYHKRTYGPLEGDFNLSETEKRDGRSIENPIKNLKISARCVFRWAKNQGKTAQEALERAMVKIEQNARVEYGMTAIPEDLNVYMNELYTSYNNLDGVPEIRQNGGPEPA